MAEYNLSEEQKEFQKLARDFAVREVAPKAAHFDEKGVSPEDVLKKAWEAGLTNVMAPDAVGGLQLPLFEAALIQEELSTGCSAIAAYSETSTIAQLPLLAENDQKRLSKFIQPLIDELKFAGYATNLLRTISGDDRSDLPTLRQTGENNSNFELEGKVRVVLAGNCEWFVTLARTISNDEKASESSNQFANTIVIVPTNTEGLTIAEPIKPLGRKCLPIADIEMKAIGLTADCVVGRIGGAQEFLPIVLPKAYLLLAASAIGTAKSALQHSIVYGKERFTFGVPIASHQGIGFMLADMAKDIEAARLLTYKSCQLVDLDDSDETAMSAALEAKVFAQEMSMRVTTDAVQVFGGYGYSREYPVEKLMRDAKSFQLVGGVSQSQLAEIGRKALHEALT